MWMKIKAGTFIVINLYVGNICDREKTDKDVMNLWSGYKSKLNAYKMAKTAPVKTVTLEKRLRCLNERSSLHLALRWTLICCRVMGLLPVSGLRNSSSDGLRFTLKSLYTIYYLGTLAGQLILSSMSLYWLCESGITLANVTNSLFYASSMLTSLILANMGWFWPKFMSKVGEMENKLPPFNRNVERYCNIIAFIVLFMALMEHAFSVIYGEAIARTCNETNRGEMYFAYNMPWIFNYLSYALWKGILFEFFNIQSTFMWSYNDLLIMVLSIYLSEHFIVHCQLLKKALKQERFNASTFRTQYLKIANLVNCFNARFGIYILTSFGTNLYWICTQLFYSLNKTNTGHIVTFDCKNHILQKTLHGIEHTIYFSYSFSFLVARTLLVLLLAARVNSTSRAPLMLLYEVPTAKYDIEVERFVDQINNMKVAMSGYGFFYVTRTMILTLVGSIITYELVLLQFNR